MREWYLFSSSSGETLRKLFAQLSPEARMMCKGVCCDRDCGSAKVAAEFVEPRLIHVFSKENFESETLKVLGAQHRKAAGLQAEPLVLLCGFFGILSPSFLHAAPGVLVNTHPSLLPAFSGLDKRVHREVSQSVAVTGFSIHLVSEIVDGGAILFQHPVWVDPMKSWEDMRLDVRAAEQHFLPRVWERLLLSDLCKEDLKNNSQTLRARLGFKKPSFQSLEGALN